MSSLADLGLNSAAVVAGAVILARFADGLFSEPPTAFHPVAWFGTLVGTVDREWPMPRLVGVLAALLLPAGAGAAVAAVVSAGALLSPVVGGMLAGAALFACVSLEMLLSEVAAVVKLSDQDVPAARERLLSLAGRDAEELSAAELRSAAVESAGENLADGLFAPLLAFALGAVVSLPIAAGAAAWVKAVNTMDSMLGYRSKPVGWASARLDDAVMFVPARLTALLLALAAGKPGALLDARRFARVPSSPNSGWPMATLAAVLGCRLRKPGTYDLFPERSLPSAATAGSGIAVVRRAGVAGFLLTAIVAGLFAGILGGGWPPQGPSTLRGGDGWF
ncbi:MAG: CobD/CbiB family cobalamin biosynthesis protein [Halolamina sp.]